MPRPLKKRFICKMPEHSEFLPNCRRTMCTVTMTLDEYETIRLIDYERSTQEEASVQMQVSRTTVQGIYDSARAKLADAIVNGKRLIISGGDVVTCESDDSGCCGCNKKCPRACKKHQI